MRLGNSVSLPDTNVPPATDRRVRVRRPANRQSGRDARVPEHPDSRVLPIFAGMTVNDAGGLEIFEDHGGEADFFRFLSVAAFRIRHPVDQLVVLVHREGTVGGRKPVSGTKASASSTPLT